MRAMPRRAALAALVLGCALSCQSYPYPGEEGAVLHVAIAYHPKSLDPPAIEDQGSGQTASHVYEGLLQYHPYARPYQLVPALAEAMPEVSEDRLTYTFRIRRGVRFHDDPCFPDGRGREVTADDFLFAFKRFSHPTTHSRGWWLFDGKIEGLNAWREQLTEDIAAARERGETPGPLWGLERDVAGFRVVDDFTFEFRLTEPYPQFLWVLAMPYASVYPREAVDRYGDEFRNHPVGTGPFVLTEFNPVYRAVYRRNPTYRDVRVPDPRGDPAQRWDGWEEDEAAGLLAHAGEPIPLVDGMEIRFIIEDQPRWLYFRAGFVDFLNPPKDNIAQAIPGGELSAEMRERGVRLTSWTELGTVYTCFNLEDETMSNVELRRAIALALDHRWMIDNLYSGQAILATSLIPPGVAGYDGEYHPYHSEDGRAQIERATEMLARAGYPGGVDPATGRRLRIVFQNSGAGVTQRQFAQRIVDDLRRVGIDVETVVNTFPQLVQKMRQKQFQFASLAWGFDYPDSQNILQLLYGPNKSPGIGSANFDHPEFNRLYEQSQPMPDGPERTALYERMAHIVADEVPWVTRVHRIRRNLQQPWLTGFKYTEVNYQFWRYAHVDAEARAVALAEWNRPVYWPVVLFTLALVGGVGGTVWRGRRR